MTITAEKVAEAVEKVPDKRRALGRGLDSLLPGPRAVAEATVTAQKPNEAGSAGGALSARGPVPLVIPEIMAQAAARAGDEEVTLIELDHIDRNPYQTRHFTDTEQESEGSAATTLQELAESIKANGVIQPIVIRPSEAGRYILILGERRCRASKLAGKTTVPAIVRKVSEQQAAEMTVIENLQRQDLNCMEQANAFARLSQEFGMTQEQIGKRVGISRESVSNYMRLLKLPLMVTTQLQKGELGFSEARVLLQLLDPTLITAYADRAVRNHLSVEQLQELVFEANLPREAQEPANRARWVDPNVRAAQMELERVLGVRVRIRDRKGKGRIVIDYATLEDYDRVVGMLRGSK